MRDSIKLLAENLAQGYFKQNVHRNFEIKDDIRKGLRNCATGNDQIDFLNHYKKMVKKDIIEHDKVCVHPALCKQGDAAETAIAYADEFLAEITRMNAKPVVSTPPPQIVFNAPGNSVNFGIMGDITNNIKTLESKGNVGISDALQELRKAVEEANELANQDKTEMLDLLKLISEEAVKPKTEQMPGSRIRAMIKGGLSVLNTLGTVATVTGKPIDQLIEHFQ